MYEHVLFNYEWLHAKLSSCPLQAALADFEDASLHSEDKDSKRELMLVADALRLGGAILALYPNMLAPQLIGRLLPEIGGNNNIKMLLKACDSCGPKDCALIPVSHCLHTPGGPLKVSYVIIYSLTFLSLCNSYGLLLVFVRGSSICCIRLLFNE